jgi:hypothetical protein
MMAMLKKSASCDERCLCMVSFGHDDVVASLSHDSFCSRPYNSTSGAMTSPTHYSCESACRSGARGGTVTTRKRQEKSMEKMEKTLFTKAKRPPSGGRTHSNDRQ